MPVDYIDKIEDGLIVENVETRYLEYSSNKWRSRETPVRFLGLGNESQELFDSGYIGDDGIDNENMRIKVYNGSLFIENAINEVVDQNDKEERHKRLIDVFSVGSLNLGANDDININSGQGYSILINSGQHYTKKVFFNDEEVVGRDKSVGVSHNYNNIVKNDYILNVGQNYISTIGNNEQHNSRNTVFNNNNDFSVNAENIVNIVANNRMNLTSSNFLSVDSKDFIEIKSEEILEEVTRNIDRICEDMNYNIRSTFDITTKNMNMVATEDCKIVTKDFSNMVNGTYTLRVKGATNIEYQDNYIVKVAKNYSTFVGNDYGLTVDNNSSIQIKKNSTNTIDGNSITTIKGNKTLTLTGNSNNEITGNYNLLVNGTTSTTFNKGYTNTVKGNRTESVNEGNYIYTGTADYNITTNGNSNIKIVKDLVKTITGNESDIVTGTYKLDVKKNAIVNIAAGLSTEVIGNNVFINKEGNTENTYTGNVTTIINGSLEEKIDLDYTKIIKGSSDVAIEANNNTTITGNNITLVEGNEIHNITGVYNIEVGDISTQIFSSDVNITVAGDENYIIDKNRNTIINKSENKVIVGSYTNTIGDAYSLSATKLSNMTFNEGLDIISPLKFNVEVNDDVSFNMNNNTIALKCLSGKFEGKFNNNIDLQSNLGNIKLMAASNDGGGAIELTSMRNIDINSHYGQSGGNITLDTGGFGNLTIKVGTNRIIIYGDKSCVCSIECMTENNADTLKVNSELRANKVWGAVYN